MPTLSRTLPLIETNLALFAKDPGPLIGRIVQPALSLVILQRLYVAALGDHTRGTTQVVVGYLVLFSLLGTSIVGNAILADRKWNTFDRLRASPAHPLELLAGKAVPILLFIAVQQVAVFGLGIAVLGLRVASYPQLILADLVWTVTVLCLGSALAMVVRSYAQLSAVIDIGSSLCAALGGCLIPLSIMPSWTRVLAPFSPAFWAMRGLRGALDGAPATTLTSCAVLAGIAALAASIALRRLARGWGRDTLL